MGSCGRVTETHCSSRALIRTRTSALVVFADDEGMSGQMETMAEEGEEYDAEMYEEMEEDVEDQSSAKFDKHTGTYGCWVCFMHAVVRLIPVGVGLK